LHVILKFQIEFGKKYNSNHHHDQKLIKKHMHQQVK